MRICWTHLLRAVLGGSAALAACAPDAPLAPTANASRGPRLAPALQLQRVRFVVTDLGSLGGTASHVEAINNLGQVVGLSSTGTEGHAFLWSAATGMIDLTVQGLLTATGINDAGQVVGTVGPYPRRIGLWTAAGGTVAVELTGLFPNYFFSSSPPVPHDINNAGQVVGRYHLQAGSDSWNYAFVWSAAMGARDISVLASGGSVDRALDINNLGQAVGTVGYGTIDHWAVLWPTAGTGGASVTNLGSLGAVGAINNVAYSINDAGQVVGVAGRATGPHHAFLWTQAAGMVDLTPQESGYSEARGINEGGQVVGYRVIVGVGDRAFLWTSATGLVYLPTPDGAQSRAHASNNRGEIVGDVVSADGVQRATLWTADFGPATAAEAIADLTAAVDRLAAGGALSRGEAEGLQAKLTTAAKQLEAQKPIVAANLLRAFLHQVEALVKAGKLTAAQGKELTDGVEVAIEFLQS